MTLVLIGGGWTDPEPVYRPFLEAAGARPRIACVVLDEGGGTAQAARWQAVLRDVAPCDPQPVLVPLGAALDPSALDGADGVLVCGGLTPAYAEALAPCAEDLRARVTAGLPYAGFSAGAAVAARRAVVGGYRFGTRQVCPEDAGEDLEPVTVVDGLGLLDLAVDVHAAQWGTLGRLVAGVAGGLLPAGIGIDEDTALVVDSTGGRVVGRGAVHVVQPGPGGAVVREVSSGEGLTGLWG